MKLELRDITKTFGTFTANDHISLTVEEGEIHALLGENGAGKSTLMNVLYGLYEQTEGEILIDGEPVHFSGPADAMAAGIGMVHQHFMLVPVFTVAENVVLGHEPTSGPARMINRRAARKLVRDISERFGFDVNPDALVEDLTVGAQQRVEIIKALSRDARLLILDEPTAVLTPQETDELIEIMRQLKAAGTSIVFITHKLREVRAIADRITVIRLGKVVGEALPTDSEADLASMMVGRSVSLGVDRAPAQPGATTLAVEHLSVLDPTGLHLVDDVSFDVARGEILAIAGVQGNGQTELVEGLMGLEPNIMGTITLTGDDGATERLEDRDTKQILAAGVGYIPEDRSRDGLISSFTIEENLILDMFAGPDFSSHGVLRDDAIRANARTRIKEFDVRTQSAKATAAQLSGGNQQKVVLAREMSRPLRLLVACQPTRGLDVGSIEFVHRRIVAERDQGTAVLVVSTELDEVLALADRIAVMYKGRFIGVVPGGTNRDVLGLMMAGVPQDEAEAYAAEHQSTMAELDRSAPEGPIVS